MPRIRRESPQLIRKNQAQSQDRECHRAGHDSRDNQVFEGVDGEGFDRIDLLGGSHVGEHRSNPGSDPARHQQSGNERSDLKEERQCLNRRNPCGGSEVTNVLRVCIVRTAPSANPEAITSGRDLDPISAI